MKRRKINTKRKIQRAPQSAAERKKLSDLATKVSYGGNPDHKRNPSDFNLSPASSPRPGATLCDDLGVVTKQAALDTLRQGIKKGLVSPQTNKGWPKHVWALYAGSFPVEAKLENPATGAYHGYPLQTDDPFRDVVLNRWHHE
jgi:hypothetical protein